MEPPPSRVPRRWTPEEDAVLRTEATYQCRMNKDCRKRWSKISENVRKGNWAAAEDAKLRDAVAAIGTRWTQVAEMVGTRHADQCAKRWTQCLDPSIDHSDWREEEDNRLLAEVAASGRNWRKIAELFPGRTKLALKNRYTALRRKQHTQQIASNSQSPQPHPSFSSQVHRSGRDELMQLSDELPSSEEEICSSMGSTRPPSRSSNHSKKSQGQADNFNMAMDPLSGLTTPASHTDSSELFQYMPHTPNQNFGFQHRQSIDHSLLDSSNFSPLNMSMSEPMLTPRPEYMPTSMLDATYPVHASSLPNEWLSGGPASNQHIHGFPFPESFDISSMSGSDRHYIPQQTSSRKTTIVLEDIEETTLSKVMNILIQEKAKVRMETTHSDRSLERR
ncbi:hypothetical protein AYO20_01604 [Fonsecaea nubica]|uniref:Uncharacterized protein n=1 Tax=Fonsecaea nubica TaxID=856822 RepID=A0A178DBZ2_9EURO|nr:hypothetical protein AYO20_01604 [Fonsecaea nubica]OAL39286.1 hypothetical protein AYO20_01604 [Fonsecaea nubica]